MPKTNIEWTIKPSTIGVKLDARVRMIQPAIGAVAAQYAKNGQEKARATSLYNDDTGELRASTFGRAEGTDVVIGAGAGHTVYVHEGTSRMAARPFILNAANETAPAYFDAAGNLVKRLLG